MADAHKGGRFSLRRGSRFSDDLRGGEPGFDGNGEWLVSLGGDEAGGFPEETTADTPPENSDAPAVLMAEVLTEVTKAEARLAELETALRAARAACSSTRSLLERALGGPRQAAPRSAWAKAARDKGNGA